MNFTDDIPEAKLVNPQSSLAPGNRSAEYPGDGVYVIAEVLPDEIPVTIFSAPRRFDTATLLIITTTYAIYFSILLAIDIDELPIAVSAGFFTFVALCQPILFKGEAPRVASVIGGSIFGIATMIIWMLMLLESPLVAIIGGTFVGTVSGGLLGYLAGALVGGIFLVAHHAREGMTEWRNNRNTDHPVNQQRKKS